MHDYLAPLKEAYRDCRSCGKRSAHTCVRCGYCYSCHPLVQEIEGRKVPANIGLKLTDIENLPLAS